MKSQQLTVSNNETLYKSYYAPHMTMQVNYNC